MIQDGYKQHLLTVARLRTGQSHIVPRVNGLPFREQERCRFKVTPLAHARGWGVASGVRVERVA